MVFDKKTGTNILQWPVKEVETLRLKSNEFDKVELKPGSLVPLKIGSATQVYLSLWASIVLNLFTSFYMILTPIFVWLWQQLDIVATFEVDKEALEGTVEAVVGYNCTTSGGAAGRGVLGPFGILVLADDSLSELTPVYFYIAKGTDGSAKTYFCADQSRFASYLSWYANL